MAPLLDPTYSASSVAEFIAIINNIPKKSEYFFTYRGERDDTWEFAPGILRPGYRNLLARERDITRDLISIHPAEFQHDESMFDRLVRMQHFNLPTRLMDVTANPLVALYFACAPIDARISSPVNGRVSFIKVPYSRKKYFDSDAVSCVSNLANLSAEELDAIRANLHLPKDAFNRLPEMDRLIQFVKAEKPAFRSIVNSKDLETLFYVQPKMNNRRIIAQNGAFLIFGINTKEVDQDVEDKTIWFQTIEIPFEAKKGIRRNLEVLGINGGSLFPEIENAAKTIVERYT